MFMNESKPYPTIAGHIDMKFFCQSVNLFRRHPTIAKHANLFERSRMIGIYRKQIEQDGYQDELPI